MKPILFLLRWLRGGNNTNNMPKPKIACVHRDWTTGELIWEFVEQENFEQYRRKAFEDWYSTVNGLGCA
jgi:hypothetical protein